MASLPVGGMSQAFPSERDGMGRWVKEGTGKAKSSNLLKMTEKQKTKGG